MPALRVEFASRGIVNRFVHSGWAALCLLLVAVTDVRAVEPYRLRTADPLLDPWRWRKLPEFDGKEPRAMVEGSDGAMWFGVGDGAVRYDGAQWRTFSAADGLTAKRVTRLCRGPDGTIYAGTEVGIFRCRGEKWERIFPAEGGAAVPIVALLCGRDGTVWGSFASTIVRLRDGRGTLYTSGSKLEADRQAYAPLEVLTAPAHVPLTSVIRSLFEDREGQIWCGLHEGDLFRFDPRAPAGAPTAWRVFTAADGYRKKSRFDLCFCQTRDGQIWIGGDEAEVGLNRYNPADDSWTHVDFTVLLGTDNLARSILETSDGTLWIGGFAKLFRYRDGEWKLYRAPEAPISSTRISMLESRHRELWLLGVGDDVQRIDYEGHRWLKHEELNFECETPDGRQWFMAADDGVVCFDGARWWRHGEADGLMASPYALLRTRQGELWAAGTHHGIVTIARLAGERWTPVHRHPEGFAKVIDPRAVTETPDGSLWFGSYVNGQGFGILQYNPAKGPPEDDRAWRVHDGTGYTTSFGFAVAGDGTLFSCSYSGMVRYQNGAWESLVEGRQIDALAQNRAGEIWAGTRGTGLFRFGANPPQSYTIEDGLAANSIAALFFDRDNRLWVGTGKGISCFDGRQWIADVFPDERLALAREGGGFRQSSDGSLWFNRSSREWVRRALPGGQLQPATREQFWTVRYRPEKEPPHTAIVSALERVSQPGNTVLTWRGIDPWWRSTADDLRYSFRIDGGPWSRFGPATSHVFLELPTGSHTFEVRARDRDLNVEATPARVSFVVVPPVWRQPWFVALMLLLTTAIATQSWRVLRRGQSLRASNAQLSAEIAERRAVQAELETKKVSLENEIEERKRAEREIERVHQELMHASHQAGMAEVAASVLHNIGNVLNSINVSANLTEDHFRQIRAGSLVKAAALLESGLASGSAPAGDDKIRRLPEFLRGLGEQWAQLQQEGTKELTWLRENIAHVNQIVAMQQAYARFGGVRERLPVREIVEDALRMNVDALARHAVAVERDYRSEAMIETEKNKVLQILVNLIRNAKEACTATGRADRRIVVRIREAPPDKVQIEVSDTGVGIAPENLTRIFNHGFTTKKSGHGFGLHGSANAARTLGGSLNAHSEGEGLGATFVLELPLVTVSSDPDAPGGR